MTIKEWSRFSGIGRTTTYSLLATGYLHAVKAGGRTLIDVDAGLAWLRAQPVVKINLNRGQRAQS